MRWPTLRSAGEYGVALIVALIAVGLRWLLIPVLDYRLPHMTVFPAIAIAAWYGGWKPAMVTVVVGFAAIHRLIIESEPGLPLSIGTLEGGIALLLYLVSCGVIVVLGEGMRSARLRAEAYASQAQKQNQHLKQDVVVYRQAEQLLRTDRWKLAAELRHKDEFLAILSHELRNPLGAALSACELLALPNVSPQDLNEIRTTISEQLKQAARILEDLLDLNRIARGKFDFRPAQMDLLAAVKQAVDTSQPLIASSGHELKVDVPEAAIWIHGDSARLSQVVVNLLSNACKYTPRGGRIQLTVQTREGHAVIRVRDNGRGIEPELLPRVFDMFKQADDAQSCSPGGLGIGLALTRRLVELQHGTIEAFSDGRGKGSEFIVWLPCVPPPVPSATGHFGAPHQRPERSETLHSGD